MIKIDINELILNALVFFFALSLILFDNSVFIRIIHLSNLILVSFYLYLKYKSNRLYYYQIINFHYSYFLFSFFFIFSSFWAYNFTVTSSKIVTFSLILINMILLFNLFREYNIFKYFVFGLSFAIFFNFLIALSIIPFPSPLYEGWRYGGTMEKSNILAVAIVFTILLNIIYIQKYQVSLKVKSILLINIVLSFYTLLLAASKKGLGFSLLSVCIYLLIDSYKPKQFIKNLLLILVFAVLIIYLIDFLNIKNELLLAYERTIARFETTIGVLGGYEKDYSTTQRKEYALAGLNAFANSPLLGYGGANFVTQHAHYSHSNYIELLYGVGLIGTILFYSMHIFMIITIYKSNEKTKIFLYFIVFIMFIMDAAYVSYYAKLYLIILTILFAITNTKRKKEKYNP